MAPRGDFEEEVVVGGGVGEAGTVAPDYDWEGFVSGEVGWEVDCVAWEGWV